MNLQVIRIPIINNNTQTTQTSDGVMSCAGVEYGWVYTFCNFRPISHKRLATRCRYSYYGTLIWIRMRCIKWCHFQWTWVTP